MGGEKSLHQRGKKTGRTQYQGSLRDESNGHFLRFNDLRQFPPSVCIQQAQPKCTTFYEKKSLECPHFKRGRGYRMQEEKVEMQSSELRKLGGERRKSLMAGQEWAFELERNNWNYGQSASFEGPINQACKHEHPVTRVIVSTHATIAARVGPIMFVRRRNDKTTIGGERVGNFGNRNRRGFTFE